MPWFYYIIALYWIGLSLGKRGYKWLELLCTVPLGLCGLAMLTLCVCEFWWALVEAFTLLPNQPLYFPINFIVAILRGMTGGFIRIHLLQ